MADHNRIRLKQTPTDVWSVRERLALASSVMRSGDQNWVSVSRAVRPFGMPNRPHDWFSQKNCALQYSELLENVETPRRKRNEREVVETPGDVIVRKLTIERIEELKKLIAKEAEDYRNIRKDLESSRSGEYDGCMKEKWEKLQTDKAAAAASAAQAAADEAAAREKVKASKKSFLPLNIKAVPPVSDVDENTQGSSVFDPFANEDDEGEDSNASLLSCFTTPGPTQLLIESNPGASPSPRESSGLLLGLPKTDAQQPMDERCKDGDGPAREIKFAEDEEDYELNSNVVEKIEIKQELSASDDTKVSDVLRTDEAARNDDEQQTVTFESLKDDVNSFEINEIELKTENVKTEPLSAATLKAEMFPFEKDLTTEDDELIPFASPEEDDSSTLTSAADDVLTKYNSIVAMDAETQDATVTVETTEEQIEQSDGEEGQQDRDGEGEEEENSDKEEEEKDGKTTDGNEKSLYEDIETSKVELQITSAAEEEVTTKSIVTAAAAVVEPTSPTSSIVSTEAGSVHGKKSSSKRGRGRKSRTIERRTRPIRRRHQSEEGKESEERSSKPSDADTSDDDEDESKILSHTDNEDSFLTTRILPPRIDPNESSLPNSPASVSHSDTEDEKWHRVWKKSIMLVWRAAANHKNASVFLHPVTEDIAPGYHSVVHKPMDLQKIKRKIDAGDIRTTAEFQRDMMLMFTNAIMYNNCDQDVHMMAKIMYKDVMGHIEQFVSTQIMVQAEPKLLRPLRRPDAIHSDKEEEGKKKRVSDVESTPSTSGAKVKKRKI